MKKLFEQFDRVADFPHTRRGRVMINDDGTTTISIYDPGETRPEFRAAFDRSESRGDSHWR